MIPKKPVPDLIGDGNRFSDKIMRNEIVTYSASAVSASFTQ